MHQRYIVYVVYNISACRYNLWARPIIIVHVTASMAARRGARSTRRSSRSGSSSSSPKKQSQPVGIQDITSGGIAGRPRSSRILVWGMTRLVEFIMLDL